MTAFNSIDQIDDIGRVYQAFYRFKHHFTNHHSSLIIFANNIDSALAKICDALDAQKIVLASRIKGTLNEFVTDVSGVVELENNDGTRLEHFVTPNPVLQRRSTSIKFELKKASPTNAWSVSAVTRTQ